MRGPRLYAATRLMSSANLLPKPRSSNAEILSCRLLIRESSSLRHCIQFKHGMFDSDNAERIISG
jgi:hypothetical protein